MFTSCICHVHSFFAPCRVTKRIYMYIYIYSFTHWPSNWALVIHIPHTHFTSWPSHWAYCRACAASDMGLSASVPLPIVMGIFVLWYICPIHTFTLWSSNWACIIHIPHSQNRHCSVHSLTSYMYQIHSTVTTWPSYWAHIMHTPYRHNLYNLGQLLGSHHTDITYSHYSLATSWQVSHQIY